MPTKSSPRKSTRRRKVTAARTPQTKPPKILSAKNRNEMLNREEPLRKKYLQYVRERPHGSPMLVHPVFYAPIIRLDRCAHIHHEIDMMEALAAELLQKGYVYQFVFHHTPPFRVAAFRKVLRKLGSKIKDEDYWETLRMVHMTSQNPSAHWFTFRRFFRSRRGKREHLMDPEERDLLRRLPETFTVYRGYSRFDGAGMSWTLDRRVADWFAHRWAEGRQPRVITGVVRRDDVLALLATTCEVEVLVPDGLVSQQVHGPAVKAKMPFSVMEYALPPLDFEAICVREAPRKNSRHRPAKTNRKLTGRSKARPQ